MKKKIYKICGVALALVLVFSLFGAFVPANTLKVEAQAYTPNQWNTMLIPDGGGRCIVTNSNVTDYAVAADAQTIYLIDGASWGVAKSTNGGRSFTWLFGSVSGAPALPTGMAAAPTAIAVAPDDPEAVALIEGVGTGNDVVWISTNGGATWATMGIPNATPSATEVLSDIAVSPARTGTILGRDYAVTSYNTAAIATPGDIYVVGTTSTWAAVATGAAVAFDFTSLALAPNWVGDRVVVAVGSDATPAGNLEVGAATTGDTYLVSINVATGALAGPGTVLMDAAATDSPSEITGAPAATDGEMVFSSIDLPADFDSTSVGNFRAYVGWTSSIQGGVILCADDAYRVDFNTVRKLEVRPAVAIYSVSYFGTVQGGTLMVGQSAAPGVWFTSDPMVALPTWGFSFKPPTGLTNFIVALTSATDAFAGGSGVDSAFSYTVDGGLSFNGISFIDEALITAGAINDVMVAPDGSSLFMATEDTTVNASLWRCYGMPAAGKWERVGFQTAFSTGSIIRLSPDYLTDTTVYWFDAGGTRIRRSTGDGQIWGTRTAPAAVVDAAVESQDILYMISGANAWASTNGAWFFGLPTDAGIGTLATIAMAPSYPETPEAGNLLVGGTGGGVGLSTDGVASFSSLLTFVAGAANMQVFADKGFATNNIVYAGSATPTQGIYRYEVGTSTAWEQIRATANPVTGLTMKSGLLYGSWASTVAVFAAGDEFTIASSGAGVDSGVITVLTGSVVVTPTAGALIGGVTAPGTLAITAGMGAIAWSVTAAAADTLAAEATTTGTSGTWTSTAVANWATASITNDIAPINATVGAGGAAGTYPFSLPDVGTGVGVGASAAERAMYPTAPAPLWTFQTMDIGVPAAATFNAGPSALRASGNDAENVLWAIDTTTVALMAYIDTMAMTVPTASVPSEVAVDPATSRNAAFTISFNRISNAMVYDIDICRDEKCTERATRNTGFVAPNPAKPEWLVPAGENYLSAGKTYYVRVRATDQVPGDAINSYWSDVVKFDLEPGVPVEVTYLAPQPLGPVPGATGVPLSPGFTWAPYVDTTKYEFKLAKDAALTDILATDTVATTAYLYADKLAYDTTYFWAVRAVEPAASGWSPVSSFTTEKTPPAPPAPPPAPPTPAAPVVTSGIIWAIIAIGAILVIAVIVLIVRTRRVA